MTQDLETERLLLRRWNHNEHSAAFAEILADPAAMRFITGGDPLSRDMADEISRRSEELWTQGFGPWAAFIKESDAFVGRIGLNRLDDWPGESQVEVGFELAREYWNRGFATEGAREALRFGFQVVGLTRIISVTSPDNAASIRVMEKCGLQFMGSESFRDSDVVWYAIDREEWRATHISQWRCTAE